MDFLSNYQGGKHKKSKKAAEKIEWSKSEEVEAQEPANPRRGLFSFFKKKAPVQPTDDLKADAIKAIRSYVDKQKEKNEPGAKTEKKPEQEAAPLPEKKPEPRLELSIAPEEPAAPVEKTPVVAVEKTSWLKGFLSPKKKKRNANNADLGERILATDLIKSEVVTYFDWKKNAIFLLLMSLLTSALIFAAFQGLAYYKQANEQRVVTFKGQTDQLESEIAKEEVNITNIIDLEKKLESVSSIMVNHIYWTKFFNFLEKNTLSKVTYSGFGGGLDGEYSLQATAKNFKMVADQIRVLQENSQDVISASTSGGDYSDDGKNKMVNFVIDLKVDKSLFKKLVN